MGTTLREIIEDIGGGIPNGKKFKAAQTGGPVRRLHTGVSDRCSRSITTILFP
jgi:NADH:ubiquinone oxidoreductase subunit F (NADH-binding)